MTCTLRNWHLPLLYIIKSHRVRQRGALDVQRSKITFVVLLLGGCCLGLNNVPDVFGGVAKLAAGDTGAEAVVADADGVVLELVCEAVLAFGHGTDEDADALLRSQVGDVVANSNNRCVEGQGHFAAVRWKVVNDWVLDDLE